MEWIKVEDRFPEPFVDVLVWARNISGQTFEKDEEYHAVDRYCIWTDDCPPSFRTDRFYGKVIFWMPLPQPPKESSCQICGCRNLYTACKDCGRVVVTFEEE